MTTRACISSRRVAWGGFVAVLVAVWAAAGTNETPKKKNAIFFAPHLSGKQHADRVRPYVEAENYAYTEYSENKGKPQATIVKLAEIAKGRDYAVLVLQMHGGESGLTMEDTHIIVKDDDKEAEKQKKKKQAEAMLAKLKKDPALKDVANELDIGIITDIGQQEQEKRYVLGLRPDGIAKLFGGADPNASILFVAACQSMNIRTSKNELPYGNKEVIGFTVDASPSDAGRLLTIMLSRMGGTEGIPKRSVGGAFGVDDPRFGVAKRTGPGNTTLAPALIEHLPPNDSLLPLKVATDGKTVYETFMNAGNVKIMEPLGCEATITDEKWTDVNDGQATIHTFKVTPAVKGQLILRVIPDKAVSKNNDNWLIGNLYIQQFDKDTLLELRTEVNTCQFGTSGLDGLRPYVPDKNPFRWCVWCGEIPTIPAEQKKTSAPRSMNDKNSYYEVPYGETLAYVLFQNAPGEHTVIEADPLPTNFSFKQVGDWYGHVIFTPNLSQVGELFDVVFQSRDDNGPRDEQVAEYFVIDRRDELTAFRIDSDLPSGFLGDLIAPAGGAPEQTFTLWNSGNTIVEHISLTATDLYGPVTISADAVEIDPAAVEILVPTESVPANLRVNIPKSAPPGFYSGGILIQAKTAAGSYTQLIGYSVIVNTPAELRFDPGPHRVRAGETFAQSMQLTDADGGAASAYIEYAPYNVEFVHTDGPQYLFIWQPTAAQAGFHGVALIADDEMNARAQSLRIIVEGGVAITASAQRDVFNDQPQTVEALLKNANYDQAAAVSVTFDVFDTDLDGALLFSTGPIDAGTMQPADERAVTATIPGIPDGVEQILVRATADAKVADSLYQTEDSLTQVREQNPCGGFVRGDSSGDGLVNFDDIDCFVAALIGFETWQGCGTAAPVEAFTCVNDIDANGDVNFDDIDGFVECLVQEGCE